MSSNLPGRPDPMPSAEDLSRRSCDSARGRARRVAAAGTGGVPERRAVWLDDDGEVQAER